MDSAKYGYFIYNSRTNSFLKISERLFHNLKECKNNPNLIKTIDKKILKALQNSHVFVSNNEDDNFYIQRKFLKYHKCFSKSNFGIVIAPTMACNFACPYCYESDLATNTMSKEVQNKLLEYIESNSRFGSLSLCWHGGEPLLAFDTMIDILNKIKRSKKIKLDSHNLVTNGFLLDKEKCNELKEHNLDSVQITIDGLPDTHNKSRKHKSGIPTFNIIVENIDILTEIIPECHVKIRINLHKENEKDFHQLYSMLSKRWEHKNLSIHMAIVADHGGCKVKCLKHKERITFFKNLHFKYGIKDVKFYLEPKDIGCTADYINSFVVGPSGELYKCWVDLGKEDRIVGNIFSDEYNYSILSEYMVGTDMFNDSKCKECTLFPVCDGGCSLFRYEHKLNGTDYDVCPINFEDLPKLLEMHYEQELNKLEA